MTALAANRSTPRRENRELEEHPVAAGVVIFAGALACLNAAGFVIPGAPGVGLVALGRAEERVEGGASNGERRVRTRRGVLQFANSGAADTITRAEIGDTAFIVDDQTVAKTNGGNTRSAAGIIRDVDARGVWVEI